MSNIKDEIEPVEEDSIDVFNNEIKKLLKLGKVVELKTVDGGTIYMDTSEMKSDEIKDIQNSTLKFDNGRITIIPNENSKKNKRKK